MIDGSTQPSPAGGQPGLRAPTRRDALAAAAPPGAWAFPGILSAGRVSGLQTLLEKGRFLLLAPWPFLCPKLRVYFYSLNEEEKEPCALSCPAPLPHWRPQSRENAVRRNVFIEGADFIPQRAVLSDFKHGIKLACGESAKKKNIIPLHTHEGLIGPSVVAVRGTRSAPASEVWPPWLPGRPVGSPWVCPACWSLPRACPCLTLPGACSPCLQ